MRKTVILGVFGSFPAFTHSAGSVDDSAGNWDNPVIPHTYIIIISFFFFPE